MGIVWWRGLGWLVPVLPVLAVMVGGLLAVLGVPLGVAVVLSTGVAAAAVFLLGRRGNPPGRGSLAQHLFGGAPIRDAVFGRGSNLRHAFLGIRLEYWSLPILGVGLYVVLGRR